VIIPTIHLNGTSKQELLEQALEANFHLRKALHALTEMYPNGRDYYPQGTEAYAQARKDHDARISAVTQVLKEIDELAFEISQGGKRS